MGSPLSTWLIFWHPFAIARTPLKIYAATCNRSVSLERCERQGVYQCVLENAHTLQCVSVIWSGWRKCLKLVFTAFYVCAVTKASFSVRHCPFQGPEGWGMNKTLFMYRQPDLFISVFVFWFKCVELTVTLRRFNPASRTNFMHLVGPFMPLVVSFSYFIAWWTERLQKQWLVHISPH